MVADPAVTAVRDVAADKNPVTGPATFFSEKCHSQTQGKHEVVMTNGIRTYIDREVFHFISLRPYRFSFARILSLVRRVLNLL